MGLSPRMRGNLAAPNTAINEPRAYPRACGGTMVVLVALQKLVGLSPRMRGNHCLDQWRCWKRRPIPAHAGEP